MASEAEADLWDIDIDQNSAAAEEAGHWKLEGYTWDPVGLVATKRTAKAAGLPQLGSSAGDGAYHDRHSPDPESDLAMDEQYQDGAVNLDPEALAMAPVYCPQLAGCKAMTCMVVGCGHSLEGMKGYFLRHRVCEEHSKAPILMINGTPSRLCQQCSKFHHVSAFEGPKRTCRVQLDRIRVNKRIRRSRKLNVAAAAVLAATGGCNASAYTAEEPVAPASRGKRPADSAGSGEASWANSRRTRPMPAYGAQGRAADTAICAVAAAVAGSAAAAALVAPMPASCPRAPVAAGGSGVSDDADLHGLGVCGSGGESGPCSQEQPRMFGSQAGPQPVWPATAGISATGIALQPPSPPQAPQGGAACSPPSGQTGSTHATPDPNSSGFQSSFSQNQLLHGNAAGINRLGSLHVGLSEADAAPNGSAMAAGSAPGSVEASGLTGRASQQSLAVPVAPAPVQSVQPALARNPASREGAVVQSRGEVVAAGVAAVDTSIAFKGTLDSLQAYQYPQEHSHQKQDQRSADALSDLFVPFAPAFDTDPAIDNAAGRSGMGSADAMRHAGNTAGIMGSGQDSGDGPLLGDLQSPWSSNTPPVVVSNSVAQQAQRQQQQVVAAKQAGLTVVAADSVGGSAGASLHPLLRQQLMEQQQGLLQQQHQDLLQQQQQELVQQQQQQQQQQMLLLRQQQQQQHMMQQKQMMMSKQPQQAMLTLQQQQQLQAQLAAGLASVEAMSDSLNEFGALNGACMPGQTHAPGSNANEAVGVNGHLLGPCGLSSANMAAGAGAAPVHLGALNTRISLCGDGVYSQYASAANGPNPTVTGNASGTGTNNTQATSKLVRMSLTADDVLDDSNGLLNSLMDLLHQQSADPRGAAMHSIADRGSQLPAGGPMSGPHGSPGSQGSGNSLAATAAARSADGLGAGAAGHGMALGAFSLQTADYSMGLGTSGSGGALSAVDGSRGALGLEAQYDAALAASGTTGLGSRLGGLHAQGMGMGMGLGSMQAQHSLPMAIPGRAPDALLSMPMQLGQMHDAGAGLGAGGAGDLMLQRQLLLAQQAAASQAAAQAEAQAAVQLQLMQQQRLATQVRHLQAQQAQAHMSVPAAGLLLSRLLDADSRTHHLSSELSGYLAEKHHLRRQLLATLSSADEAALVAHGAGALTGAHMPLPSAGTGALPLQQAALGGLQGLGPAGLGLGAAGLGGPMQAPHLAGAAGGLGMGLAGMGCAGGRPSAAAQLQALNDARMAAVGAGMGAAPGGGPGGGGGSFAVPELLTRVSLKIMNCLPEQLPPDVRARMQAFASQAPLELVQGCLRPGCTELVMDALCWGEGAGEAGPLWQLLRGGDAAAAAAALLRVLPAELHDREMYLQAGDLALCLRPHAPPRAVRWHSVAMRRGGVRVSKPLLAATQPRALHAALAGGEGDVLRLRAFGRHLADPGVTLLARMGGTALQLTLTRVQPAVAPQQADAAAASSPLSRQHAPDGDCTACPSESDGGGGLECYDVEVVLPHDVPCQGLLVLEPRAGVLLGGWCPVLVCEEEEAAAEMEGLLAGVGEEEARRLLVCVGVLLDHGERCAAAETANREAAAAAGEEEDEDCDEDMGEAGGRSLSSSVEVAEPARRRSPPPSPPHGRVLSACLSLLSTAALRGCPALLALLGSGLAEAGVGLSRLAAAADGGWDLLQAAALSGSGPALRIAAEWAARGGVHVDWRAQVPDHPPGTTLLHVAAALPPPAVAAALDTLWALAGAAAQPLTARDAFASVWFGSGAEGGEGAMLPPSALAHAGAAAAGDPVAADALQALDALCLSHLASAYIRVHNVTSPLDHVNLPSSEGNSAASASPGAPASADGTAPARTLAAAAQLGRLEGPDTHLRVSGNGGKPRRSVTCEREGGDDSVAAAAAALAAVAAALGGGAEGADAGADRSGHGSVGGPPPAWLAALGALPDAPLEAEVAGSGTAPVPVPLAPPATAAAELDSAGMPRPSPPRMRVVMAPKALQQAAAAAAAAGGANSSLNLSAADASLAGTAVTLGATTTTFTNVFGSGSMPGFGSSALTAADLSAYGSTGPGGAALPAGLAGLKPLQPLLHLARPLPGSPDSLQGSDSQPAMGPEGGGGQAERGLAAAEVEAGLEGSEGVRGAVGGTEVEEAGEEAEEEAAGPGGRRRHMRGLAKMFKRLFSKGGGAAAGAGAAAAQ